ncbi:hypothetical protein [Paenibacillus pinistramenti]|uniref:hypothetical protein n=1 Tax=Paenibacillus pinistramenti TaxID=1768003 RepID=UPI001109FC07|nr:hypothetical protein [Paenibacillus pinistramenti]
MLKFLPPAKSNQWFLWYLIYAAVVTIALSFYRFVRLGDPFDAGLVGRFALLSLALSGVLHICGWFGGKLVWLITTAGLIVGFYSMFRYTKHELSGWEDLATFFSFLIVIAGAFVLGLVVEGAVRLYRHYRYSQD